MRYAVHSRAIGSCLIAFVLCFALPSQGDARAADEVPADASRLDAGNSQRPDRAPFDGPLPDEVRALADLGYIVRPIADLEVLNTTARTATPADAAIDTQKGSFDVVANGTFYGGADPVGPIVRDGQLDTGGYGICAERGGVARLHDGTIVVARTRGGTAAQVADAFGATADNPVEEAMGGGALLLEAGDAVTDGDLRDRQNFKQGDGGIQAAQMYKTKHSLMGIRDGVAYHLWAANKSGAELQEELRAAGFSAAVMFDGGNAGYYDDGETTSSGRSPALLGLGLTVR